MHIRRTIGARSKGYCVQFYIDDIEFGRLDAVGYELNLSFSTLVRLIVYRYLGEFTELMRVRLTRNVKVTRGKQGWRKCKQRRKQGKHVQTEKGVRD